MDKKKIKRPVGPQGSKRNNGFRTFLFILIIGAFIVLGLSSYSTGKNLEKVDLSDVINRANNGEIAKIEVVEDELKITPKDKSEATQQSRKEAGSNLYEQGLQRNEKNQDLILTVTPKDTTGDAWLSFLSYFGPVILIGGLLFWLTRSAQGQGNQAMSFGRSKARLYGNEKDKVTFKDIAGSNEAKDDLEEIVDFLKNPKKYEGVGARIPKGMLLVGPPGTGKTMLARAVAGEADVPFFSISGSEFVEMFVGVGASRVRDLFGKAKKNAPCIIFVDEIDAVGRRRGSGMGGGHDEREQTLNQILVEMDGFEQGVNVIVLAATNRADVLDPALLRPGRFDRRVNIGLPDRKDREAILKVHFAKKPLEKNVNLDALAAKTAGTSGTNPPLLLLNIIEKQSHKMM